MRARSPSGGRPGRPPASWIGSSAATCAAAGSTCTTDDGLALAAAPFGLLGALSDGVMDEFTDAELATVHRFLARMTGVVADYSP